LKGHPHEVLCIGNPFIDHIIEVDDAFIEEIAGQKGGMVPVTYNALLEIIHKSGKEPLLLLGGSGANTLRGLTHLGHRCGLVGRIGQDAPGHIFLKKLKEIGAISYLVQSTTPTAQAVCLITPDKERTMRSFLGASSEMSEDDIDPSLFQNTKLVHLEGYSLMNGNLTQHTMEIAKQVGAKVSFDLGSFEVVSVHRETIIGLLGQFVDILFANAEELYSLVKRTPEEGCQLLNELCDVVVILLGKEGCLVGHRGEVTYVPAQTVDAVDTTGAGDLFASGFLHGYLKGVSVVDCARYGVLTGAAVVQVRGVDISAAQWKELKKKMCQMQ